PGTRAERLRQPHQRRRIHVEAATDAIEDDGHVSLASKARIRGSAMTGGAQSSCSTAMLAAASSSANAGRPILTTRGGACRRSAICLGAVKIVLDAYEGLRP